MTAARWRNQIVGHGEEAPDQLLAHPLNFRIHPKGQQDALLGAIHDVGYIRSVLVNRTTGHVIDGHLRVALAISERQPTIPVEYVELTPEQEAEALATLDPLAAMAGKDQEQLARLLEEFNTNSTALQQMLSNLASITIPEIPIPDLQPEPELKAECFVEIYCSEADLAEFRATLDSWNLRKSVTLNIS